MWQAFVFEETAVTVRHWFEIDLQDGGLEHGCRVEVRRLAHPERRGSESAAQRTVLDQPIWRADLFDRLGSPPGTFTAAHFHSTFDGVEPGPREWSPDLTRDPWGWTAEQLSRTEAMFSAEGTADGVARADALEIAGEAAHILAAGRAYSPTACTSVEACHASTRDVADTVRLMVENMHDPSRLDAAYVAPWLDDHRS
jgi:hypothetical protein